MVEKLLHYRGLAPNQHSGFDNRRGARVPVYSGEWVRIDLDRHPEVRYAIDTGAAVIEVDAPEGTEILDESTYSGRYRFPPVPAGYSRPRGVQRSGGHPQAYRLSELQINSIAKCFIWPKDPAMLGIGYVKDYPPRRGPKPALPRLAPSMHPMFITNFPILCRLAELRARKTSPDPYPGAGMRRRARITAILREWGVWDKEEPPSPASLNRYRRLLGLSRREIDTIILSCLMPKCDRCGCSDARTAAGNAGVACHQWNEDVICPHCGIELFPAR